MIHELLEGLAALLPAAIYLAALVVMDSYKLVPLRKVLVALAVGAVAVLVCRAVNGWMFDWSSLTVSSFIRYVAPVVEEIAKGAYLVILIRRGRVGFAIDAAVFGFAVGTGFGMVENVVYLADRPEAGLITWVLRGCGTALMHGSTAAVFAIVSHGLLARRPGASLPRFLPGLVLAVAIHSTYNHFLVSPVLAAAGLVIGLPVTTLTVFRRSERALERWLDLGFDTDAEMLASLEEGTFDETHVGRYLTALRDRFPPLVVADMFCLLQLEVELSIRAKGMLMLRKRGYDPVPSPDVPEKLAEIEFLERNLGPTGRLAIRSLRKRDQRDLWQTHLLRQGTAVPGASARAPASR